MTRCHFLVASTLACLGACGPLPQVASPPPPRPPLPQPPAIALTLDGTVVHLTLTPYTTVTWHGERGDRALRTDSDGHADLDLTTLPPQDFPYRRTLARLEAFHFTDLPLRLPAEVGAALVTARGRLDDLDAWLAVHPGAEAGPRIRELRREVLQRDRQRQDALVQKGLQALDHDRFPEAKAAVTQCGQLAYGPTPACEELDAAITRKFVRQQGTQVQQALQQECFEAAEAAAFRCRVAAPDEALCRQWPARIVQARVEHARRSGEAALVRRDFGLARTFAQRCATLAPELPACGDLAQRIAIREEQQRQREVGRAVTAAKRAMQRRQWRTAQAAWEQCVVRAPQRADCAAGLQKVEGRLRRGR